MALFKPRRTTQRTLAEHIDDHMREIKQAFASGTKLTLVVRSPQFDKPFIFTNDTPEETIAAIRAMTTSDNLVKRD